MRPTSLLPLLLALTLAIPACDLFAPQGDSEVRSLTQGERQVVDRSNTFGFNLFRATNEADADKSVFISPLSVSMALGMLMNGAGGETLAEIEEMLGYAGLSRTEINESYRSLIDLLSGLDKRVLFQIANSIWHEHTFHPHEDFLEVNRKYFDAVVRGLDFRSDEAVDTINDWVNEKTQGLIEKIIEEIPDDAIMYLINAIYFKGTWTYQFDEKATREMEFHAYDGSTTRANMMLMQQGLAYYQADDYQIVDLPYGNEKYSMTVVLPSPGRDINAFVAELTETRWNEWIGALETQTIELGLPRFTLEYEVDLNDILKQLGMRQAFGWGADLSPITGGPNNLFVGDVKHKTFVKVDEEGTEAAAVTSIEIGITSGPSHPVMIVNRPFVFAIREKHSGSVLFMGRVLEA